MLLKLAEIAKDESGKSGVPIFAHSLTHVVVNNSAEGKNDLTEEHVSSPIGIGAQELEGAAAEETAIAIRR